MRLDDANKAAAPSEGRTGGFSEMRRVAVRDGVPIVEDFEPGELGDYEVRIRTEYSAISPGTELMHLRNKAGLVLPGYSGVGIVEAVGCAVEHLQLGQRAAVYGVPTHSEIIIAPKHLTVPVPDSVDPREAAFAGLGTIAIHALRQADAHFGESLLIVGLGILGQLVAQVGYAASSIVLATDKLETRRRAANQCMPSAYVASSDQVLAEQLKKHTERGEGVDCVLLCAGSHNDTLLDQSIGWLRDRGRIVIVGVPNPTFNRNALFSKEVDIRISRAGGPGRYDEIYEQSGVDYPLGYVRWTEGRNLAAYIRLLQERRITVNPMITSEWSLSEIGEAYRRCSESPGDELGVLLKIG